ncbi:hypothetical protein RUM44_009162 [Polyplax serrata]|uniref:Structural maintenance of chromosomes protein n=1 Tax=Polyplax serrata TaxID=468196 RepID=A0ABR1ARW6_POLSC
MYVKSIVIDGFKSYGRRTEISGFDREFNAITGLNGSGKSNILDAICFVLGLQNLGQVRATLLQDLVYKQGQTGVTKASVSITFDNCNKEQSPVGYESYDEIMVTRQVVMGGKNKYFINGLNAPNNRVKDLFCSVQLNVNNPHFLVMQGRITKVLNMKPLEILSMIEEAAGTRMFESKKQQAEKTLEKKDAKLAQIDEIVNDNISPKLTKLKEERGQYLEFKKIERELEHLQKIYIAWKYVISKQTAEKADVDAEKIKDSIISKKQYIENGQKEIMEIEKHMEELQHLKDVESGGKLADTETQLREQEKNLTKSQGAKNQCSENMQDEKKKIKQLEKNIKDDENILKNKTAKLSKIDGVFQGFAEEEEKDRIELEKAQNRFQALSSGLVADDAGKEATLQDKLIEAERQVAQAQTEIEQCNLQLQHCKSDLKKKTNEMQTTKNDVKKDGEILETLEKEVVGLEKQISNLGYDACATESLQKEHRQLKHEIRSMRDKVEAIESRDVRLSFRYRDPETNFNRKSVHGLVCKLFDLTDPQFAVAIEKTAGGRLFNVVVDTDITSKKLLDKGKLERRTTIIPLNKITGRRLDTRVVQIAEKSVGKGNVWPALSLLKYDSVFEPAMQYVFGTTFICRDLNVAKKVCYHPDIMKKCVTLDGDTCDPSGTLSGGARQQTQPVLLKIQEAKMSSRELEVKEARAHAVEHQLQQLMSKTEQYNTMKQKLDLKSHELNVVRERLQKTTHYQCQEEVNSLKNKIDELMKKQEECHQTVAREKKQVEEIQKNMKNAKQNREKQLREAENEVKNLRKKSEQSRKEREKRAEEYDGLKLEVEELKKSIESNTEQIQKHKESIQQLEEDEKRLENEVTETANVVKQIQAELKVIKETIVKKNREISEANKKKDQIVKQSREMELEIKQYEQDEAKLKEESRECKKRVEELHKSYDWILQEEQFFGQKNGIYDFNETDPKEAGKRIGKLQELKDKLGKNINTKAMNLLTKTEEQYNELMKKRRQVEDDKMKILEVIRELGEKKKEALKQAWIQVNKDFSSIFSTLLPGAVAKLEPQEGLTVLEGLEFRVGFGGKWKESLGELSGGQRSLVALSLILSMLLFKPAPIYILDEVDAALDLSHTQNIGIMLKSHFKTSQFIIVSLKDGMFNNANVLFRTKFVDGMSTVTRTVQGQQTSRKDASNKK